MNCILLATLMALGEKQCNKWGLKLESIDLHATRGGAWISCLNKQTMESMYIAPLEIKNTCIQLK